MLYCNFIEKRKELKAVIRTAVKEEVGKGMQLMKEAISDAVHDALRGKVRRPSMPHPLPSLQATPSSPPTSSPPTYSPPAVRKSDAPDVSTSFIVIVVLM